MLVMVSRFQVSKFYFKKIGILHSFFPVNITHSGAVCPQVNKLHEDIFKFVSLSQLSQIAININVPPIFPFDNY